MSFLKQNPIPTNSKKEFEYLSLFETARPDEIRGLTDHEASSLHGWLKQRQQRYARLRKQGYRGRQFAFSAFFLIFLVLFSVLFQDRPKSGFSDGSWYSGFMLAVALGGIALCLDSLRHFVHRRAIRFETQADRLEPLNKSRDGCSELLELVRTYPEILAYRNDVIGVGRQLLQIDLEMAYELRAALDDAQAESIQLEACRQLHNVRAAQETQPYLFEI